MKLLKPSRQSRVIPSRWCRLRHEQSAVETNTRCESQRTLKTVEFPSSLPGSLGEKKLFFYHSLTLSGVMRSSLFCPFSSPSYLLSSTLHTTSCTSGRQLELIIQLASLRKAARGHEGESKMSSSSLEVYTFPCKIIDLPSGIMLLPVKRRVK